MGGLIKTGRTHLMDAMPVKFSQEMSGWRSQLLQAIERFQDTHSRLSQLAIGGTAVGTGVNTHPEFGARVASALTQQLGLTFYVTDNHFSALSAQDTALEYAGQLNVLAASIMKISNDLRWMNSGPLSGLGEISLTKLQSGNFQLNVMLPLIGANLLTAIGLLANSCEHLADKAIADMQFNGEAAAQALAKNPILVTALNAKIGYEKGAQIAKKAYEEKRSVLDVAKEETDLTEEELTALLDPAKLV